MVETRLQARAADGFSRVVLWLVVVVGVFCGGFRADPPAAAGGSEGLRIQGRLLSDWLKQLAQPNQRAAAEAARALVEARYWIVQAPQVVQALGERIEGADDELLKAITYTLTRFGPLAHEAVARLSGTRWARFTEEGILAVQVARARSGHGGSEAVYEIVRMWPGSDELHRDHDVGGVVLRFDRADVARAILSLGPRNQGSPIAAVASDLFWRRQSYRTGGVVLSEDLDLLESIGRAERPLVEYFLYALKDKAKVRRPAVLALAACPLGSGEVPLLLAAADALSDAELTPKIVRRIAVSQSQPVEALTAFFRRRIGVGVTQTSAWAHAGLARLAPQAASQLPFLQRALVHEDAWIRAGALEALRHLGAAAAPLFESAELLLEDHDVRVRWRAGAVMLAAGRRVEAAVAALGTGLQGADDDERLQALEIVADAAAAAHALPLRPLLDLKAYRYETPLYLATWKAVLAIDKTLEPQPK